MEKSKENFEHRSEVITLAVNGGQSVSRGRGGGGRNRNREIGREANCSNVNSKLRLALTRAAVEVVGILGLLEGRIVSV